MNFIEVVQRSPVGSIDAEKAPFAHFLPDEGYDFRCPPTRLGRAIRGLGRVVIGPICEELYVPISEDQAERLTSARAQDDEKAVRTIVTEELVRTEVKGGKTQIHRMNTRGYLVGKNQNQKIGPDPNAVSSQIIYERRRLRNN